MTITHIPDFVNRLWNNVWNYFWDKIWNADVLTKSVFFDTLEFTDRQPLTELMKKLKTTPLFALVLAANTLLLAGYMLGPGACPPVLAQAAAKTFVPVPASDGAAKEINAFQEADQKRMPPAGAVLFMGSSSIKLWDTLAQDFPEIPVINRGFGGSYIHESTRFADLIAIPYKPKMIVLCAGTNDLAYGNESPPQVFQDYQDFVTKIHVALPDTRIVYLTINPTVARWKQEPKNLEVNHLIEEFTIANNSKSEKLNVIDPHFQLMTADNQPQPQLLRSDGLHFNAEGYKVWASLIKPRILALAALDGVQRLDAPKAAPLPQ